MLSPKPWQVGAVIQLIAGVLASLCLGAVVLGLLREAGVAAFRSPDGPASILVGTLSFHGAAWVLILFFLFQHGIQWPEAFGLTSPNLKSALWLAFWVWLVMLPVAWGLQQASGLLFDRLGWPVADQRAVDLIVHTKSQWLRVYLVLFAVVLAPVAEEFIFRGMLYPCIKQLGWPKLACWGTSLLFALIHGNALAFVPLLVLAVALTWLYERTDCLLAPITVHALFNAANLVVLFLGPPAESAWVPPRPFFHPA